MNQDHKRMFVAFALSALVLFMWQTLMPSNKQNQTPAPATVVATQPSNVSLTAPVEPNEVSLEKVSENKSLHLVNGLWKYEVDSFLNVKLVGVESNYFAPDRVLGKNFVFSFFSQPILFTLTQQSETEITASNSVYTISLKLHTKGSLTYFNFNVRNR